METNIVDKKQLRAAINDYLDTITTHRKRTNFLSRLLKDVKRIQKNRKDALEIGDERFRLFKKTDQITQEELWKSTKTWLLIERNKASKNMFWAKIVKELRTIKSAQKKIEYLTKWHVDLTNREHRKHLSRGRIERKLKSKIIDEINEIKESASLEQSILAANDKKSSEIDFNNRIFWIDSNRDLLHAFLTRLQKENFIRNTNIEQLINSRFIFDIDRTGSVKKDQSTLILWRESGQTLGYLIKLLEDPLTFNDSIIEDEKLNTTGFKPLIKTDNRWVLAKDNFLDSRQNSINEYKVFNKDMIGREATKSRGKFTKKIVNLYNIYIEIFHQDLNH